MKQKFHYSFFVLHYSGELIIHQHLVLFYNLYFIFYNVFFNSHIDCISKTNFGLFFNYYLAAPRPTLGHYRGDSFTHPMLITAFYIFGPKVTGSLVARLGP